MRSTARIATAILAFAAAFQAAAAGPFDGVYQGHSAVTKAEGRRCPPAHDVSIRVRNGAFIYRRSGYSTSVRIGPDGSFSGQAGAASIKGRISDSRLEADSAVRSCVYHITAERS
jgi:hypothetical protein